MWRTVIVTQGKKLTVNAYNLADDIMEPFRPLVDLWTDALLLSPKNNTRL